MYRFAICDDVAADADYIKSLILEWNREAGQPLRIESYPSAEAFLFAYEDDDSVDVLFLDIEMKEMSGVELAGRLREMGAGLQIVFITGYMDYIGQGYDVEALHYLLKPVTGEKLRPVLDRAMKRLAARENALLLTCGDGEERAEVYGCAADRQQASIVFEVAADMVKMCPALSKRVKILASQKRIIYQPTNSFYQVLSAEAYTKHGLNVHAVIFDELHSQPNRELFDVMTKGSGDARTQPLFFLITTAGTDRHSVCFEQHQKAEDILQGRKIDPTFYPVIYGASDNADWSSEDVWRKANPSLGHTIDIEKVRNAYLSAKDNPAEENIFRQLRLNQWVKQSTRWMQMEKWDACAFPVDEREVLGRECYGGLDLSSSIDITAFVLVFPPRNDTEKYILLPYFWIPEENMRLRVRRDHVPYDVWERQGYLQTTEGNVIHYGFIENFIDDLGRKFHIKEIAFDRWGAVQMVQNLEGLGFTVVPFGQGFKDMSPPTKRLMELVLEKNIAHGGHPVLRWMMDNIFVRTDPAGNIKPDKEKSTEKIDGAVATIMGLDRAIRNSGISTGSVYDERGILSF